MYHPYLIVKTPEALDMLEQKYASQRRAEPAAGTAGSVFNSQYQEESKEPESDVQGDDKVEIEC
jgi:hypothetical protein